MPECEILTTTIPVKAHIRNREFYKILSVMETGAEQGMWTWQRYRGWMEKRRQWFSPDAAVESADEEGSEAGPTPLPPVLPPAGGKAPPPAPARTPGSSPSTDPDRIVIEPVEGGLADLLKKLE